MNELGLHAFHHSLGAQFAEIAGEEVVLHYGDTRAEHAALRQSVGVLDLSFRGRICVVGVEGPKAADVVSALGLFTALPAEPFHSAKASDTTLGEIYLANLPRTGAAGFDLFVPVAAMGAVADKLIAAAKETGGRASGW